jgi:hypothetical protein
MRTLVCIVLCALSSVALAGDRVAVVRSYALEVKDRIQSLELINVTAEKPVSDQAQPLDPELAAVLAETESREATALNASAPEPAAQQ